MHGESRVHRQIACLALLLPPVLGAHAENLIPQGEERLKLNVALARQRTEATLRLDAQSGSAREFSLERSLGLDSDPSVPNFQLAWRLASRHRLGLRAYRVMREAERTIDESIDLGEVTASVNTRLRAESDMEFFIADYRYSFVKSSRMELAGVLGVFGGRYRFTFNATQPVIDVDEHVTVPVPVVGASADFYLAPRWSVSAFAQGLYFNSGDWDLRVYNIGASTDYMLTRHLGVGLAYTVDFISLDVAKDDFDGRIGLRTKGVVAFLQARF